MNDNDDQSVPGELRAAADRACFRRAEGLRIVLRPCDSLDEAEVTAKRPGGGTRAVLDRSELALLGSLGRWRTADEAGVPADKLLELVDADFLFWSPERPSRDLTGAPVRGLTGRLALRRNVTAAPLFIAAEPDEDAEGPTQLPFMPRYGSLAETQLVGFEFMVIEMDIDTLSVVFECCAHHARVLRDLIPQLDGRRDATDLARDDDACAMLEVLDALGLLERREETADAKPDIGAGKSSQVTWLCHAGVLYESGGKRILVDPLEYPFSVPSRHSDVPPDMRGLGDIDAVLITHGDNDHLNPTTLCRLSRATPIYLPRARTHEPYHVDMEAIVALLGFDNVTLLDEWERVRIGGVTIVATPFRGEDWGLYLPCLTYLLSSDDLTIYCNADSTSTPEAYERLTAEFAIDLAFVGVTGASEAHVMPPRFGYGHFYEPWIPPHKRNQWAQFCNGPVESADVARRLRARFAFGYAAGGSSFAAVAYTDRGTHRELAKILQGDGGGVVPLEMPLGVAVRLPPRRVKA